MKERKEKLRKKVGRENGNSCEHDARSSRKGRAAPRRETRGGRGGKGAGGGEAYLLPAPS